jgi:imidazolonepropionase-like amidohydrolase
MNGAAMKRYARKVAQVLMAASAAFAASACASPTSDGRERLAIVGATLIDGTGRPPVTDSVIYIADGKIERVSSLAEGRPPAGVRIDAAGKYVIPGLVDAHTHIDSLGVLPMSEAQKEISRDYIPRAFLYNGVTSVVNLSAHDPEAVLAKRDLVRSNPDVLVPRIYTGAAHFTAEGGWGGRHSGGIRDAAEIEQRLDQYKASGVDLVKIILEDGLGDAEQVFPPLTDEHVRAVTRVSRSRNLPVFIHATDEEEYRRAIDAEPRAIVHGLFGRIDPGSDIPDKISAKQIYVVPTAVLFESFFRFFDDPALLDDPHLAASVPDFVLGGVRDPAVMKESRARMDAILKMDSAKWARAAVGDLKDNARLFAAGGIKLAVGTDSGGAVPHALQGYNTPRELQILAECCMTAMQTLVAATRNGAEMIGGDKLFGTIEAGKSADLLILNADPLTDMKNIRDFDRLVLRGRLIERSTLTYQSYLKERSSRSPTKVR